MEILLATTLTCVVLVVETTEIGKGLSQVPVLSLDGLLNNIMKIYRTVAVMKSNKDSSNSSDVLQFEHDIAWLKEQNKKLKSDVKEQTEKLESDTKKVNEKIKDVLQFENDIAWLREQNKKLESDMKTLNEKLNAKDRRAVFEAQLGTSIYFDQNDVLIFPKVTLNTGNAYNPHSGIFLVPADGTYLLWANVMCGGQGYIDLVLMRGQEELTRGHTGADLLDGTATINHVVQLKKGDHVWFTVTSRSPIDGVYSSFGGVLLYPHINIK